MSVKEEINEAKMVLSEVIGFLMASTRATAFLEDFTSGKAGVWEDDDRYDDDDDNDDDEIHLVFTTFAPSNRGENNSKAHEQELLGFDPSFFVPNILSTLPVQPLLLMDIVLAVTCTIQ